MTKRTVTFTVEANGGVTPAVPQFGGVKGEHNATDVRVIMNKGIYQDGDVVRLSFTTGDGTVLSSDLIDCVVSETETVFTYELPQLLTIAAGQLCMRVVVSRMDENGNEVECWRSHEMVLYFDEASVENGTPFWTGVSEMLKRTVDAKNTAVEAAETAFAIQNNESHAATAAIGARDKAQSYAKVAGEEAKSAVQSAQRAESFAQSAWEAVNTPGRQGLSAYEVAVKNGFVHDELSWLATLKGEKGKDYVLTDADKAEIAVLAGNAAPAYVAAEAEEVADKLIQTRTANSLVLLAASDIHVVADEVTRAAIRDMGQGMAAIRKHITPDGVVLFGDYNYASTPLSKAQGIDDMKYCHECVSDATVGVPTVWMDGNHDRYETSGEHRLTDNENYTLVGAHNGFEVTVDADNVGRNYGYIDFNNQRVRLIYLNTTDVSGGVQSPNYISNTQYEWLANTALNMSGKDDADKWGVVVCSHFPIYAEQLSTGTKIFPALETLLCAYKDKAVGTVSGIAYNFTDAKAELIATFHGHIHNFKVTDVVTDGGNVIKAICIPNACINRENPYTGVYQETDDSGDPVSYPKTANSRESTSFNAIVIDRDSKTIHAICYGAGYDRVIEYTDGEVVEIVNQIPLSTDASGAVYNDVGYQDGIRLGSDGADRTGAATDATGFIPITLGDKLYFKNCQIAQTGTGTDDNNKICCYKADKSYLGAVYLHQANVADNHNFTKDENNNLTMFDTSGLAADAAFIRIAGNYIGADSVITKNQPIA